MVVEVTATLALSPVSMVRPVLPFADSVFLIVMLLPRGFFLGLLYRRHIAHVVKQGIHLHAVLGPS